MEIVEIEPVLLSHRIPDDERWKLSGIYGDGTQGVKSDMVIMKVHTDEGIVGLGEPSPYGGARDLEAAIERMESSFVGEDPFDVDVLTSRGLGGADGVDQYVLAGLNMACWDIMGKAAGEPVSKLLGGRRSDEVRVYASAGINWDYVNDPELIVEEAEGYLDEGFTAFKFRIGPDKRFLTAIERLYEAVGDEMDLIMEGNARFRNPQEAIRMAESFKEYEPYWFEEPIDTTDVEGYREIRRALPDVRITGGESKRSLSAFKEWIDTRAYSIVQPDANVTGISEGRRIAERARLERLPCVPHSWHNAITMAANLHLVASIPNNEILEFQRTWHWSSPAFRTEILEDPIEFDDGHLVVPDGPGLGIELDEDAIEEYPFEEGPVQESWEGPAGDPEPI